MNRVIAVIPILFLTFAVSCQRADTEDDPAEQAFNEAWPGLLKDDQIEEFINAKLIRDRNPDEAQVALTNALRELIRKNKPGSLCRAVYWFKLSRAYGGVFNSEEERKFAGASKRLTESVQARYLMAFAHAHLDDYKTADSSLRDLLAMLPRTGRPGDNNKVRENIEAHRAFFKRFILTDK